MAKRHAEPLNQLVWDCGHCNGRKYLLTTCVRPFLEAITGGHEDLNYHRWRLAAAQILLWLVEYRI
jgi:hypothetical protein